MAKKKVAQEHCPFCGNQPCECPVVDKRHRTACGFCEKGVYRGGKCPYCNGTGVVV